LPTDEEAKQLIRDMVSRARKKPKEDDDRRTEWKGAFEKRMAALGPVLVSFDELGRDGIVFTAKNSPEMLSLVVTLDLSPKSTQGGTHGGSRRRTPAMTIKGDADRQRVQIKMEPGELPTVEIELGELTDDRLRGALVELCQQALPATRASPDPTTLSAVHR
jgi:hypothetical protein